MFHQLSRFQLLLIFVALMTLRIVVGYHFFKEGTNKLQDGFTAEYFLKGAKGPLAPYFHKMVDDHDGSQRLCVERVDEEGESSAAINTEITFAIWDDFIDRATSYYGFGSPDLIEKLKIEQASLLADIEAADSSSSELVELEQTLAQVEADIKTVSGQPQNAEAALESHRIVLEDWLRANRVAILAHYQTEDRLGGFDRDGENRDKVATYVDSLRWQVDTIRGDRDKAVAGWKKEVDEIWDSLEDQINGMAVKDQLRETAIPVHRPFDQEYSKLSLIDRIIPWFDTIVGVLLIIGLFSRFASLAAAGFLLSVVLTQPPWIPGTTPTFYQCIELAACLVIFATAAGRMGGLDYFFSKRPQLAPETEPLVS